LRERIQVGLAAEHVEVMDESARHAGHEGARAGASHYRVVVVSDRFTGRDRVARHRAIYEAAGDMIPGEVHALSATAYTPVEWRALSSGGSAA
jgi:BolA protein